MPLSELQIKALKPRAIRYAVSDGRGLALEVMPTGGASWRYRYTSDVAFRRAYAQEIERLRTFLFAPFDPTDGPGHDSIQIPGRKR